MANEQDSSDPLSDLLSTLDRVGEATNQSRPRDAIDRELAGPGRVSDVRSLRDAPEIAAFRTAVVDGLIRADTANRLLRLIDQALTRFLV